MYVAIDIEDIVVKRKRKKSGITVLIDMDVIVYTRGFAAQREIYEYKDVEYVGKKSFKEAYPDGISELDSVYPTLRLEVDSLKSCLRSVDSFINDIIHESGAESYKGYLTGSGNFRKDIATIKPYKGGRPPRPVHYQAIRDHLIENWGAYIAEGSEADDYLAIEHEKDYKTVLASIDKDLLQVEGWHYQWNNPTKGVFYVNAEEATFNFYYQLLIGDSIDCIVGCAVEEGGYYKSGKKKGEYRVRRVGVGPDKAKELLSPCKTDYERYEVVLNQYINLYPQSTSKADYKLTVKKAKKQLLENSYLLWMVRRIGSDGNLVMWQPPE
jgi:hypothetical protein